MNTNSLDSVSHCDSSASVELDNLDFQLPPFPSTASQLMSELNSPEVKIPNIIELIECEPVIFSKVLNLANSPLYGASRPIKTIGHAFVLLGVKAVSQLAVAVSTEALFSNQSSYSSLRSETYFQSLAIATVARVITRHSGAANPDEAFLCGVIHDVGKLVLLDAAGQTYADFLTNTPQDDIPDLEHKMFGTTHAELGYQCGQTWGLSSSINQAIQSHHLPVSEVSDPLSASIVEANTLARRWGIGFDPGEASSDDLETEPADSNNLQGICAEQYEAIRDVCLS